MSSRPCCRVTTGRLSTILLTTATFCLAVESSEMIKEGVAQYFAAVQSNDIGRAKEFVLEKSRASFSPQFDSKLIGVRVAEIHLEKNKTAAVVKLLCQVMVPSAMQPVD